MEGLAHGFSYPYIFLFWKLVHSCNGSLVSYATLRTLFSFQLQTDFLVSFETLWTLFSFHLEMYSTELGAT